MAEIFLSYASDDRDHAASLAGALEKNGWSVWWDRRIIAGETFDAVIEQELTNASCVVVLWSAQSVKSEWVRNEAAAAMERNVLVPVSIDSVKPPLEFRRRHTLDLINWTERDESGEFQALLDALASVTQKEATPLKVTEHRIRRFAVGRYSVIAIVLLACAGLSLVIYNGMKTDSAVESISKGDHIGKQSGPKSERKTPITASPVETKGLEESASIHEEISEVIDAGRGTVDNPEIIDFNRTYRVKLEKNEESFLQLSSDASEFSVVVDVLLPDHKSGNIQGSVSVLDSDGVVMKSKLISFNEIDSSFRKLGGWSAPARAKYGIKLLYNNRSSTFFVTALKPGEARFVPFFGLYNPNQISLETPVKGQLKPNGRAFYAISLAAGSYKAIIDFNRTDGANANIQGYLAVLDSQGGSQKKLVSFNEIGVSHRKAKTFDLEEDTVLIFKIGNSTRTLSYTLKVREK